jgi:polar amino acid transport system substrate-binding protein
VRPQFHNGENRPERRFPQLFGLTRAAVFDPGGGAMALKRLVQAAIAVLSVAAAMPSSAQQLLKVGSTPTGIPFTFLDTKTNSIQGIMVDLITEIGKDAGFQVQIEPMQFSALVPSLTSNKIDIISAAMFATATRKEVIDFSDAVYTYGEGLVVPKSDARNYASQEDLKGQAVGAQVGTAFVDALKKTGLFSEVKIYDTIPDILRDVNAGRLKAGFADYPILAYNLKQGNFAEVRLVDAYKPVTVGTVAIGVRKSDTELLAKINASLAKLKTNGTIAKILEKWGQKADAS